MYRCLWKNTVAGLYVQCAKIFNWIILIEQIANSASFCRLYWERGFTINHWAKTIILLSTILITGGFAWVIIQTYVDPIIRVLTAGIAILIGYVCIKLLGENTVIAYHRAKVSSINIMTGDSATEKLHTICQDVKSSS